MPQPLVVRYPAGRSRTLTWLLGGVGAGLWVLVFLASFGPLAGDHKAWKAIVLIVIGLMASLSLWRFWRQQAPGELECDGEHWLLHPAPGAPLCAVGEGDAGPWRAEVRLDAQRWMLLRLLPMERRGAGCWRWVQASSAPQRWHRLRCALYVPQTAAGRHGAAAAADDAERA